MRSEHESTQETRTETVTVALTATEKIAVKAVAASLNVSDSSLLRTQTLDEIMRRYERVRAAVGEPVPL